ncbi:MAG: TIGR03118 family protein [Propionibacteriales bacterium]|nr:TIGR03118 family protein [Propionibacteriales bacterium]
MSKRIRPVRRSRRYAVMALAAGTVASLAAAPTLPSGAAVDRAGSSAQTVGAHPDMRAFHQVNLVSDIKGMAKLTDPDVKNPWGIAFGPDTPLWVANQFNPDSAVPNPTPQDLVTEITVYSGANGSGPITKIPLEVKASSPFGIVYNPTDRFVVERNGASAASKFLWNEFTVDATGIPIAGITGWSPDVPPLSRGVIKVRRPGAVDLGIALERTHKGPRLLVANVVAGTIDVYDGRFQPVVRQGAFVDPDGAGLAPYNVAFLHRRVYVAYTSDSGVYAISVFSKRGRFIKRLVTGDPLDDPWGMAIAPRHWGGVGGDLLVGSVESGRIDAFNRHTGAFEGALSDRHGDPLVNPGIWGLQFGNGVIGTRRSLIFAAGIGDEVNDHVYEHGLIGKIRPTHR